MMKKQKILTSLLITILLIISVSSVYAIDDGLSTSTNNYQCKNLYWFDNNNKECGLKKFCDAYMYLGLNTFDNKDSCLDAINRTNCPTEIMCIEGYEGCTGTNGCPTCCKKICQNFPPPNFCPGGTGDIVVTGTDNNGCSTYGCKNIPNLILLYANFTGSGIWKWDGSTWSQATPNNPEFMVTSESNLYGAFTGHGIWKWDGSLWSNVTPSNPQIMTVVDSTLYGVFTGAGVWKYNDSAWSQVTPNDPELIVASGSTLYGAFANHGIWKWDGSLWSNVTSSNPKIMTVVDSTLHGVFTGAGVWKYNGSAWSQVTPNDPELIVASGSTLYGAFAGHGIWKWDGSNWSQITPTSPQLISATGSYVYSAFAGSGIWKWDGSTWIQITPNNPASMVTDYGSSYINTVKVYKSRGSVQCSGGGTAPEIMQNELIDSGIEVISYSCGSDGRAYPAVCGGPDGKINIFEIPKSMIDEAQSLGFINLNTLPDASEIPCN